MTASARVSRNKKKSWRQDSSSPRSMRSNCSGRSVTGGVTSSANHVEPAQLRQQAGSQIAGNPRDHYSWFCVAHLFGTGLRSLHRRFRALIVLHARFRRAAGASAKYFSFNCGVADC